MIPVRIEDVDRAALDALIDNAVAEGRTIEYKQALPGKANSEVDPVVATVTSFANTDGGDLLLGVRASKGMPLELPGIEIQNRDRGEAASRAHAAQWCGTTAATRRRRHSHD